MLNQEILINRELSKASSFEHPKHMLTLMDKKIFAILRNFFLLNWPYDNIFEYCNSAVLYNTMRGSRRDGGRVVQTTLENHTIISPPARGLMVASLEQFGIDPLSLSVKEDHLRLKPKKSKYISSHELKT